MNDFGIYHVFNKSIAGYKIFNSNEEYKRMITTFRYYSHKGLTASLAYFFDREKQEQLNEILLDSRNKMINLIAYCLMPTHLHFILQPTEKDAVSTFMSNLQNSYTRFFNLKHKRKGPLWEGRFKKVLVETDEQLLHLSRYVHLNPATADLVNRPENWEFSSYGEYIGRAKEKVCSYNKFIDVDIAHYKKFVTNQIGYQRELAKIKKLLMDEPG